MCFLSAVGSFWQLIVLLDLQRDSDVANGGQHRRGNKKREHERPPLGGAEDGNQPMESYQQLVRIPCMIGRGRWFSNANLSRMIMGYHLSRIDPKKQNWGKDHLKWLDSYQVDGQKDKPLAGLRMLQRRR
jgi:hypothetical protein